LVDRESGFVKLHGPIFCFFKDSVWFSHGINIGHIIYESNTNRCQ
jgi:hypothetical protein